MSYGQKFVNCLFNRDVAPPEVIEGIGANARASTIDGTGTHIDISIEDLPGGLNISGSGDDKL